jgi:ribose transport system ATP-binding protein
MLRLQNISKQFYGVQALHNVSLEFGLGHVHAICGENGAGKTTLMNIIVGNIQPDDGEVIWNDRRVVLPNVLTSQRLGIAMVYQEGSLVDSLSIGDNVFPVHVPRSTSGLIDYDALFRKTKKLLDDLQLYELSPKTLVKELTSAQRQMVEIAKAIATNPKFLILDEPTASITHKETAVLFSIITQLKSKGVGIIYISHRMAEIGQIADVISVLKDGRFVGTVDKFTPLTQIVRMMVGRDLETVTHKAYKQAAVSMAVESISGRGFRDITFDLHKGEILGFAGLHGSARSALAKAIYGDEPIFTKDALKHRVAYLPEDRKKEGLFTGMTIAENFFSARLQKGAYVEKKIHLQSRALYREFNIKTSSEKTIVRQLSGGNQQKVLLAKWLALQPDVMIVNEPTHGVDVGAKAEIYQMLNRFIETGKSVLVISSELPELLLLSDRIAVMHQGKIAAVLDRDEATEERVTSLASGM